jgi:hypothetical protein
MKEYFDEDNIPLNIVKRNLIRKEIVIKSNKKHLKDKNFYFYIINGILKSNITNLYNSVKFDEKIL